MYKISMMKKEEIPSLIEMWHNQYSRYCNSEVFPDFWSGGKNSIALYLENQIEQGNAIVSKKDDAVVGFMAWMYFDFHDERTAFCPIIGHATVENDGQTIYHKLYTYASHKWVENNRFNHLWMIFNDDCVTKDMLYDIGFGSYVIDACINASKIRIEIDDAYIITRAKTEDVDVLYDLVKQSVQYYIDTPIFLKRHIYTKQEITDIIKHDNLFVAWDKKHPIGFMNLSVNQEYDTESLASLNSGLINELGAYIKPEYRGMGVGKRLLNELTNYCVATNIPYIHVCFETSNPFANRFWRKYFKPIVLSVRRTVNKDANPTK